jgi:putative mRNA 3-end processing factor
MPTADFPADPAPINPSPKGGEAPDAPAAPTRAARADDLIVLRPQGLYCPPGDFYIDPWRAVPRAVITHAHADHARTGHGHYLASAAGERVLRARLGKISLQTAAYGERVLHNGVAVSLHPAGHVLGSAQVRVEWRGQVWVASGDYKTGFNFEAEDTTCAGFEPVRCHAFITESTFGLPIYRWQRQSEVFEGINAWWRANANEGRVSLIYGYSFGKAQRLLAGVDASIGPIICHSAVEGLNRAYRESGVALPDTLTVSDGLDKAALRRALVIAPPAASGSAWAKRFGDFADAFASGWMALRGARRRQGVDRGFVLSDHADWAGLSAAIRATGCERLIVTHGSVPVMVRYWREQGLDAQAFQTEYGGDDSNEAAGANTEATAEAPAIDVSKHQDGGVSPTVGVTSDANIRRSATDTTATPEAAAHAAAKDFTHASQKSAP